jgi:hypothetical protein
MCGLPRPHDGCSRPETRNLERKKLEPLNPEANIWAVVIGKGQARPGWSWGDDAVGFVGVRHLRHLSQQPTRGILPGKPRRTATRSNSGDGTELLDRRDPEKRQVCAAVFLHNAWFTTPGPYRLPYMGLAGLVE